MMQNKIQNILIIPDNEIERIIFQLEAFSIHSEEHFLAISQKLQQFYASSKIILNNALKVTNLLTSDGYKKNVDDLKSVLSSIIAYSEESENKFEKSEKVFSEIICSLNEVNDDVADFKKIVKHLSFQAIAVKIESSRFGNDDKGFGNLAHNINNLAALITSQSTGFKEKSKLLKGITESAELQISNLKNNQHLYSVEILKFLQHSLNALVAKYEVSSSKASQIHSDTEILHREISSLVTAIQFHDITRQQIETVKNILQELIKKMKDDNSTRPDEKELLLYVYKITKLQSAQLNNSKKELYKAVVGISENLEEILRIISVVSVNISELMENSGSSRNSFIEKIKIELHNVSSNLIKNVDVEIKLSESIKRVVVTIGELSEFINEISNIGSEIELIAVNANIKAAHTGKEGASLSVLAVAIQKLSSEAKKQTDEVIKKLLSVKDISNELHNTNNESVVIENEKKINSLSGEINKVISSLNGVVEDAVELLKEAQLLVNGLEIEIRETITSNNSYLITENDISDLIEILDIIVHNSEILIDKSDLKDVGLDELNNNYTMKTQRDIHNSLLDKSSEILVDNSNNEDCDNSSSEFGDNVELF